VRPRPQWPREPSRLRPTVFIPTAPPLTPWPSHAKLEGRGPQVRQAHGAGGASRLQSFCLAPTAFYPQAWHPFVATAPRPTGLPQAFTGVQAAGCAPPGVRRRRSSQSSRHQPPSGRRHWLRSCTPWDATKAPHGFPDHARARHRTKRAGTGLGAPSRPPFAPRTATTSVIERLHRCVALGGTPTCSGVDRDAQILGRRPSEASSRPPGSSTCSPGGWPHLQLPRFAPVSPERGKTGNTTPCCLPPSLFTDAGRRKLTRSTGPNTTTLVCGHRASLR